VAPKPTPAQPRADIVQRSFRGKQFDADFFQYCGPTPERYVLAEDEGLRMTLPPAGGPAQPVGVMLRYPIDGDFELEATFKVLQIDRPATSAAGLNAYFLLDSADRDGILFGKLRSLKGGTRLMVSDRIGAERRVKEGKAVPAPSETGTVRFRAARAGSRFRYFVAQGEAADFELLDERDVSAATVVMARFAVDPGWLPDVAVDARLVDFALRGQCVGYVSTAP
jgi:hypothetical protein